EISSDDALELLMQPIEIRFITTDPAGREMTAPPLLSNCARQPLQLRRNLRILLIASLTKCGDNLRVSSPFHRARAKDTRLPTRRLNILLEPLEILVRLVVEG